MKLKNPMLVVTDIDKSVEFYKKVFGLHVIMDFGANKNDAVDCDSCRISARIASSLRTVGKQQFYSWQQKK